MSVAAAGSRSAADLLPEVAIVLFDGTAWRVIDPTSTDSTGSCGSGPAAAAPGATVFFDVQGRLWQQSGLSDRPPERFDRTRWILGDCPPQPEEGRAWNSRWVAPDGGTWYGGPSGVERIQTEQ